MKSLLAILVLISAIAAPLCYARAQAPAVTPVGRWKVEFTLSDLRPHVIQFDALESGVGVFLLLDTVSSLVEVHPMKAAWSQTGSEVSFSGDMEFPLGNVGREVGILSFIGSLSSAPTFTGEVSFVNISKDQPTKSGTFVATRVDASAVRLLSLNSGEKVKRGRSVKLDWLVQDVMKPTAQQLFLSSDDGSTFNPLSPVLDGEQRSFVWDIPKTMRKTKKALIRIRVQDADGKSAEDISDSTFRIK